MTRPICNFHQCLCKMCVILLPLQISDQDPDCSFLLALLSDRTERKARLLTREVGKQIQVQLIVSLAGVKKKSCIKAVGSLSRIRQLASLSSEERPCTSLIQIGNTLHLQRVKI